MSHILTAKNALKVKFKNLDLLRRACEAVVGAKIGTAFKDYYNVEVKVDLSVTTQQVPRGIGFVKSGDGYAVKYDPYGTGNRTEDLIDQVSANYQKLGYMQVLNKYRYTASVQTDAGDLLVVGRQY